MSTGWVLGCAVRSEWTKLRTGPGTAQLLVAAVVLTIAGGAAAARALAATPLAEDPIRLSLVGLDLGQALVAIVGVRSATGEWDGGMAVATYCATPRRHVVLAAKAITVGAATAMGAIPAVCGSVLAGALVLTPAGVPVDVGAVLVRAVLGAILYAVLVALLALGVGTAVRDRVTALAASLGLLYLFPLGAQMVTNPPWQRLLQDVGPMPAGMAVEATTHLAALPIAPWAGLAVTGAWSVGMLVLAGVVVAWRDL